MNRLTLADRIIRLLPASDRKRLEDELMGTLHEATANGHPASVMDLLSLVFLVASKHVRQAGPSLLLGLPIAAMIFIPLAIVYEAIPSIGPSADGRPPWEPMPICMIAGARAAHLFRQRSYILPGLLIVSAAVGLAMGESFIELEPDQSLSTSEMAIFVLSASMPLLFLIADRLLDVSSRLQRRRVTGAAGS